MSDKITARDGVFLAAIPELFDGKGWHGKGIPTTEFTVETLKRALFQHEFAPAGIMVMEKVKQGAVMRNMPKFIPTGERYAVALDDGRPIGPAVGDRYNTPSNLELFELFKDALAGSKYEIVSCGTVDNRLEFFTDAKAASVECAGRTILPYVGIQRCFGGMSSIMVCGHSMVKQCGNTTVLFRREFAEKDANDKLSLKNTTNVKSRLEWLQRQIDLQHGVQAEFLTAMEEAAKYPVSKDMAREAFTGLVGGKELSTRAVNRANRLVELFETGKGNSGHDAADWFNGVTDLYTHSSSGCNVDEPACRDKQWYSSERGSGMKIKADVASKLFVRGQFKDDALLEWQAKGRELIKNAAKEEIEVLN